jgi:hypothetical protein
VGFGGPAHARFADLPDPATTFAYLLAMDSGGWIWIFGGY